MGYAITRKGLIDSANLGNRHKCKSCGTGWYDLGNGSTCPGPSANESCEEGAAALSRLELEPENKKKEKPEEAVVYIMKERTGDDHFDDPEYLDDEEDSDYTEEEEIEFVDISDYDDDDE